MENYKWLIVVARLFAGPLLAGALGALVATGLVGPDVLQAACERALADSVSVSSSSTVLPHRSAAPLN